MANRLTPPADFGFIGLGKMGAPMARALVAAGYQLFVLDADANAADRFAEENVCERPGSPADLAKACPVEITMLPNGDIVRDVIMDEDSPADNLSSGAIIINMSSSSPLGTRELARELENRDIAMIDAPVSGGVIKAEEGALTSWPAAKRIWRNTAGHCSGPWAGCFMPGTRARQHRDREISGNTA